MKQSNNFYNLKLTMSHAYRAAISVKDLLTNADFDEYANLYYLDSWGDLEVEFLAFLGYENEEPVLDVYYGVSGCGKRIFVAGIPVQDEFTTGTEFLNMLPGIVATRVDYHELFDSEAMAA